MNTLFLDFEAHLQSYANCEKYEIINTERHPTKSAVMGIILAAFGISREDSRAALVHLNRLKLGVRIDKRGELVKDFQILRPPMMQADGKMRTDPSITRRTYLADAKFLVALQGDPEQIGETADAVKSPNFPLFLGRAFCFPYRNLYHSVGNFEDLEVALKSVPCETSSVLDAVIETKIGSPCRDVLIDCMNQKHYATRNVKRIRLEVPRCQSGSVDRRNDMDPKARAARFALDKYRCVCCGMRAKECHHVTYVRYGAEKVEDLRSLCGACHKAVTSLEYTLEMYALRIDPLIPSWRDRILELKVQYS